MRDLFLLRQFVKRRYGVPSSGVNSEAELMDRLIAAGVFAEDDDEIEARIWPSIIRAFDATQNEQSEA